MNFSEDQVRQLYVVLNKAATFTSATAAGSLKVNGAGGDLFFTYQTPNGDNGPEPVRSDLIPIKNIDSIVASSPALKPLTRKVVSLNSSVNSGAPVVGQEYILRLTFTNYGVGGAGNTYIKEAGAYRVKTGDTASTIMTALKNLALKNFSREPVPLVTFEVSGNTLVIQEVAQQWVRGKKQASPINFVVQPLLINTNAGVSNSQDYWGTVTDTSAINTEFQGNGRITADMEWFFLGERADQYREYGYPDNFETTYLADPSKLYEFVDIAYHYAGDAEDIQKSKKHITLAVPKDSNYAISTLITDIGTATGLTVTDNSGNINRTMLAVLVEESETLVEADYTTTTWTAFAASLATSKATLIDPDSTSTEIASAYDDLLSKKEALVLDKE